MLQRCRSSPGLHPVCLVQLELLLAAYEYVPFFLCNVSQLQVFYTAKNITAVHGHAGVVQGDECAADSASTRNSTSI